MFESAVDNTIGLVGGLIQNKQNKNAEKRQQQWNLDQWHRQNKYNSPIEQMARFKEAGLNPHLIYGKGSASAGQASDVKPYTRQEAKNVTQGLSAFGTHHQLKNLQAQTDNVQASKDLANQQAVLINQKVLSEITGRQGQHLKNKGFVLDNKLASRALNYNVQAVEANAKKLAAEARSAETIADNIGAKERAQIDLLTQQLQTEINRGVNINWDTKLKQYENKLNKEGISKSDNAMWRILQKIGENAGADEGYFKAINKYRVRSKDNLKAEYNKEKGTAKLNYK